LLQSLLTQTETQVERVVGEFQQLIAFSDYDNSLTMKQTLLLQKFIVSKIQQLCPEPKTVL
jgi:hypothetical protein